MVPPNKEIEKMKNIDIEGVAALMQAYDALGEEMAVARKATNFYCLEGCGACCYTPSKNLEVTLFEAIPMAMALIKDGVHEAFLAELEVGDCGERPCVMYSLTSEDGKMGFCKQYEARPLICRLFGSSKKVGKDGVLLPIVCKPLKAIHFGSEQQKGAIMAVLPLSATVSARARALNLGLSQELFGINEAVRRALHYVLQRMEYGEQ